MQAYLLGYLIYTPYLELKLYDHALGTMYIQYIVDGESTCWVIPVSKANGLVGSAPPPQILGQICLYDQTSVGSQMTIFGGVSYISKYMRRTIAPRV